MINGKQFISLGIEFQPDKINKLQNRMIYSDTNFPPTKPVSGGFWGSSYTPGMKYKSEWEKYIMEVLDYNLFEEKLTGNDTIFEIEENARVLALNKIEDVWIEFKEKMIQSNLTLRQVKIGRDVPQEYKKHLYLDFNRMCEFYDAMYVSSEFVHSVDWILREFERRVLAGDSEYDDNLTPGMLYVAELFEDWNVDSILVFNKEVIKVVN